MAGTRLVVRAVASTPSTNSSGREAGGSQWESPQALAEVTAIMAMASRLWRMSLGWSGCSLNPGLFFSVSTSVISNPCACFSRCCTRERRQGGLWGLPSNSCETCCCSAVSSRASATAGLESVSTLAPSWEASASACSSSGERCPLLSMCTTSQGSWRRWAKRWP
ncbi:hypothetical protein D3C79_733410 [compost metagenome]